MEREITQAATTAEIVDAARAALSQEIWDYIEGAAETETTARRNRAAFDRLALRPRVLRNVAAVDTTTELAGLPMRIPLLLAPLGSTQAFAPDGALASAQAAERFGIPVMVSSVTEPSFTEVAARSTAAKIAQIYIRGDEHWSDELVDLVVRSGYDAIAVTVDMPYYGRRERQLRGVWRPPSYTGELEWQARLDWEWMARMRDRGGLPFVLKGIQTAEDAERAAELGVEVIYVSNHGGRQLDHAEAALETLPEVIEAVAGRSQVVIDGGIAHGTDALKAIALGADAVGIGRLQAYALAAGGTDALVRMLEILEEEIRVSMGLLGVTRLDQLDPSYVKRAG